MGDLITGKIEHTIEMHIKIEMIMVVRVNNIVIGNTLILYFIGIEEVFRLPLDGQPPRSI